jgi:hypothetical protein
MPSEVLSVVLQDLIIVPALLNSLNQTTKMH